MKRLIKLLFLAIAFIILGCSAPIIKPIDIKYTNKKISYLNDVKPILDKRCVTCHSCYNAPCQAKFDSFDGVDRGGSKIKVYDALRLRAIKPTRLFEDAFSTNEWRKKGFYSLTNKTDSNTTTNDSIMMYLLHDKKVHPEIVGSYDPANDDLSCPKNKQEVFEYIDSKPNHGMPYGFPALKEDEYTTLAQWLAQGAKSPNPNELKALKTPNKNVLKEIRKWENFLNKDDAKHKMSARYIYEHYYLAEINFDPKTDEFYKLRRSKTPAPLPIDPITTLRPFDDPKVDRVYYRFEKIYSTIVHKTHIVVTLNDEKLKRIQELFIKPKWLEKPHLVPYEIALSANPFLTYAQIPPRSRYQFLLDNAHYTVMTFIRGPSCRGQMALNVIHDNFWVMFKDPNHDLSVLYPKFLIEQADNLSMPIETNNRAVLETFSNKYRDKYKKYFTSKENFYNKKYPDGQGLEAIWKGRRAEDAPLLSVYRHFNSASVHKGVIGAEPRTMWVIDYPQFERIYYSLVAGYDVFGNISHQTNIRRYMDFLRAEGEINFLAFMPQDQRLKMFKSWYIGDSTVNSMDSLLIEKRGTKIKFKTIYPKNDFIEQVVNKHILKSTNINFDVINYFKPYQLIPKMPKIFKTKADILKGARSLTAPGTNFITHVTDQGLNNILVRVKDENGLSSVYSIIINRWHDNVNSLLREESTLNPKKDTMDIIHGSIGSYPNVFVIVESKDLVDFMDLLKNFEQNEKYIAKFKKYFISRSNPKFWETYDWFQNNFNKTDQVQAGLYDLNRYFRQGW